MTPAQLARLVAIFRANRPRGLEAAVKAVAIIAKYSADPEPGKVLPETLHTLRTARTLVCAIAQRHRITTDVLASDSRLAPIVRCRQECYARLREMGFSVASVARIMRRDRSTVIEGLRRFEATRPDLAAQLRGLDELADRRAA